MFDCIVVGAGVAGCVAAREMAEAGKMFLYWKNEIILAEMFMMKRMHTVC